MRRHASLALVATAFAMGVVLVWPSVDHDSLTPVPAGAVLEATAEASLPPASPIATPAAAAEPTAVPMAVQATASAEPPEVAPRSPAVAIAGTPAPTPRDAAGPDPATIAKPRPARLALARALEAERPGLAEPDRAPDPKTLTGYRWPIARIRITNPFGPSWFGDSIVDGQRFHDGLDLATFCGDRIVAAHDGVVLAAGRRFDAFIGWSGSLAPHTALMDRLHHWGSLPIVVITDDGNGYRSIYAHFNALANGLRPGDRVQAGQFLGWEGATGFASGCHLHFGLFSPFETARFKLRPDIHRKTRYPAYQIARIDPLLVLPHRPAAKPSPSPKP